MAQTSEQAAIFRLDYSYGFSMDAVNNDHKFSGLKQHKFILGLCRSNIRPWSRWAKIKVPAAFILDTLRETLFPCCFQGLEFFECPPFSIFKARNRWSSLSHMASLWPSFALQRFEDLCNYIGSTWIIQDNLPISRSLNDCICKILKC